MSDLEEKFHQHKRYGMSIRRIITKKAVQGSLPRKPPPLQQEDRPTVSKSVIFTGAGSQSLLEAPIHVSDQKPIEEKTPAFTESASQEPAVVVGNV